MPINPDILETWTVEALGTTFECPHSLLDLLVDFAISGFATSPAGGPEVGGVLFGTRTAERVRILAHRPIDCEHAFGPAFELSERDEAGLERLLREPPGLEENSEAIPVGWYHSEYWDLCFSKPCVTLHNRYFPELWQVAITIERSKARPVRLGIYGRDAKGLLKSSAPLHVIEMLPTLQETANPEIQAADPVHDVAQVIPEVEETAPLPETSDHWSAAAAPLEPELPPIADNPQTPDASADLMPPLPVSAPPEEPWHLDSHLAAPQTQDPSNGLTVERPLDDEEPTGVMRSLLDAVVARSGLILVTGPPGAEMDLLLPLGDALKQRSVEFALLLDVPATISQFYQMIADDLNLRCSPRRNAEHAALEELLLRQDRKGSTTCLILDHAHGLSLEIFAEIQRLSELSGEHGRLLQTILFAVPEIEGRLRSPELLGFLRRINVRVTITPE